MTQPQCAPASGSGQGERKLPGGEIHLYFSRPEHVSDPDLLRRYAALLSDDERARMSRFHFSRNREQYLLARALVRASLSRYYPVDPASWRFDRNAYGKPEVTHPEADLPIRFNLSHTNGLSVCAIARNHAVGVDVENTRRTTHSGFLSLARYFSPVEIEELHALPENRQTARFFDYWTLKESYIKARGAGFAIPLDKFGFRFEANKMTGFWVHPQLQDQADNWQFWRIRLSGGYRIAIAVESPDRGFKISAVNSVPLDRDTPIPLHFL
jgi:4'-phosphopantetheinyl transferase